MNGNHHYLPQFYLKGFCNSQQKLHTYNKQYQKYKEFYPAQIHYIKGLNDVVIKGNFIADLENDIYQDVDNIFSNEFVNVLQKYNKETDSLSLSDKKAVVDFVLNLYWRVPSSNQALIELIDNEGLLNYTLELTNSITGEKYSDSDIPNIISDIKRCDDTKKTFKLIADQENRLMFDWAKLDDKFHLIETNLPLIIGDIPFVALKSENRRGKILEEFMFPFSANKVLVYAEKTPNFLEINAFRYFSFCIFEKSLERVSCNDIEYLKFIVDEMDKFKERQKLSPKIIISDSCLSKLLAFESKFSCFDEFEKYYILNKPNFASYL